MRPLKASTTGAEDGILLLTLNPGIGVGRKDGAGRRKSIDDIGGGVLAARFVLEIKIVLRYLA